MNSPFRRALRLAPIAVACVVIGVVSCTQQGDGQRCSHLNGNLDCADGLVCVSSKQLGGNADICCLPGTIDTNPECIPGGGTTTGTSTTGAGGANGSTTSTATTTTTSTASTSTATTTTSTSASTTTASSTSGTTTSAATTTSTAAGG